MAKRKLMEFFVSPSDFKYEKDALRFCGEDEELVLQVDGDIDPPDWSVGIGAQAYLYSAEANGVDLLPMLTEKCKDRLEEEYIEWVTDCEAADWEDAMERRAEERRER